jgi:hypothetical protein
MLSEMSVYKKICDWMNKCCLQVKADEDIQVRQRKIAAIVSEHRTQVCGAGHGYG